MGSMMTNHSYNFTALQFKILSTARIFFEERGYEETAIKDITTTLSLNEDDFYTHFSSKDEILEILWSGKISTFS